MVSKEASDSSIPHTSSAHGRYTGMLYESSFAASRSPCTRPPDFIASLLIAIASINSWSQLIGMSIRKSIPGAGSPCRWEEPAQ